jgi:hypothetical protein
MEYAIYVLVFLGGGVGGSVFGALWGRSNAGTLEKVVANYKAEISKAEKKAADLKAQMAAQGLKV